MPSRLPHVYGDTGLDLLGRISCLTIMVLLQMPYLHTPRAECPILGMMVIAHGELFVAGELFLGRVKALDADNRWHNAIGDSNLCFDWSFRDLFAVALIIVDSSVNSAHEVANGRVVELFSHRLYFHAVAFQDVDDERLPDLAAIQAVVLCHNDDIELAAQYPRNFLILPAYLNWTIRGRGTNTTSTRRFFPTRRAAVTFIYGGTL